MHRNFPVRVRPTYTTEIFHMWYVALCSHPPCTDHFFRVSVCMQIQLVLIRFLSHIDRLGFVSFVIKLTAHRRCGCVAVVFSHVISVLVC